MPTPNEHILRFTVPKMENRKVLRVGGGVVNGVDIPNNIDIVQFKDDKGQTQPHSLRFKRSRFDVDAAKIFIEDRKLPGTFEAASGEGGTKGKAECPDCGEIVLMGKDETAAEHLCPTCEAQMKARTIETTTMEGMNIFRAGRWLVNGKLKTFDIDFIDKVIANFKKGVMEPYIKITADGTHAPQPPIFRNLAFGWVDKLWRVGERLFANFKDVPVEVKAAIKKGLLKKRSVEIPMNFPTGDGEMHGPVLKNVLFFGQGQPVVHGLEDMVSVFNKGDEPEGEVLPAADTEKPTDPPTDRVPDKAPTDNTPEPVKDNEPDVSGEPDGDKDKENTMPEMKISEQDYEALQRSKIDGKLAAERLESIEAQMKENSDAKLAAEAKMADVSKENETLKAKVTAVRDAGIETFVAARIDAGQIKPASKDAEIAHMKVMDEAQETEYRADMEKLAVKYPAKAGLANKEPDTASFKTDGDRRDAQITAYLDANIEFVAKHGGRSAAYAAADEILAVPEPVKVDGPKED